MTDGLSLRRDPVTPRVLRCLDLNTALQSLASLFGVPVERIRRALPAAKARAFTNALDPTGALPTALATELGATVYLPDKIHYFHGSRAIDPATFAEEGLLPCLSRLDILWSELAALAPEIPAGDLNLLREDLTAGSIEPHTYSLRVSGKIDEGPFGELVRDVLLYSEDYSAVHYLNGGEIASDICDAVRERFHIHLAVRYQHATTPCVVEFAVPSANGNGAVAAAAWYVEAAVRGEHTADSNWAYDGGGAPVPATAIVSVLAPDGTVLIGN